MWTSWRLLDLACACFGHHSALVFIELRRQGNWGRPRWLCQFIYTQVAIAVTNRHQVLNEFLSQMLALVFTEQCILGNRSRPPLNRGFVLVHEVASLFYWEGRNGLTDNELSGHNEPSSMLFITAVPHVSLDFSPNGIQSKLVGRHGRKETFDLNVCCTREYTQSCICRFVDYVPSCSIQCSIGWWVFLGCPVFWIGGFHRWCSRCLFT